MAVSDMVAIASAALVAFLATPVQGHGVQLLWFLPTLPAWVALFGVYNLYQRQSKRIGHAALEDLPAIFHALVVGTLALWLYYHVVPAHDLVYMQALVFGVLGIAFTSLIRLVVRRAVPALLGRERVLFLGEAPSLPALVRKIRAHPEYGLEPVGLVPSDPLGPHADGLPILGRLDDASLTELVERHDIERLIVSRAGASDETMLELLQECRELSLKISLLPAHVDAIGPSVEVDDIEGITVLGLNPLTLSRSSRFLKRSMDIVGATCRPAALLAVDRLRRRRRQAGLPGKRALQAAAGRQEGPGLPGAQVPHHGPRRRAAGRGAVRAQRGPAAG